MNLDAYKHDGRCPVCHSAAKVQDMERRHAYWINCTKCGKYALDDDTCTADISSQYKLRSCLYYYLSQNRDGLAGKKIVPLFTNTVYGEEGDAIQQGVYLLKEISTASIMQIYPKDIHEKIAMIMVNLGKEVQYIGNNFSVLASPFDPEKSHLLFIDESYGLETKEKQFYGVLDLLEEENLIEDDGKTHQSFVYKITSDGWALIDEYQKAHQSLAQGFIAMWFDPQMEPARRSIMEAIKSCGYIPIAIDMKEHNNQIVPEILFEISRSEFVVADLTGHRGGVYYEAGYAEGLGKQVITCCNANDFEKMHFDLRQKSTIIWADEADLSKRLKDRIEATVGRRM